MKVKIKRSCAGHWPGYGKFSFAEGEVVAVPDGLAGDLIHAGHAEPAVKVKSKPKAKRQDAVKIKRGE